MWRVLTCSTRSLPPTPERYISPASSLKLLARPSPSHCGGGRGSRCCSAAFSCPAASAACCGRCTTRLSSKSPCGSPPRPPSRQRSSSLRTGAALRCGCAAALTSHCHAALAWPHRSTIIATPCSSRVTLCQCTALDLAISSLRPLSACSPLLLPPSLTPPLPSAFLQLSLRFSVSRQLVCVRTEARYAYGRPAVRGSIGENFPHCRLRRAALRRPAVRRR
jgi:hypothetical protein